MYFFSTRNKRLDFGNTQTRLFRAFFSYDNVTTFPYLRNAVICQQFNHFIIAEFLSILNKT